MNKSLAKHKEEKPQFLPIVDSSSLEDVEIYFNFPFKALSDKRKIGDQSFLMDQKIRASKRGGLNSNDKRKLKSFFSVSLKKRSEKLT